MKKNKHILLPICLILGLQAIAQNEPNSTLGQKSIESVVAVGDSTNSNASENENKAITQNEVVVVGYGTQKRGNVTGSVVSVSQKEMSKLTVGNVASSLQGRAAGVSVNTDGGIAGGDVNVIIRGSSSLTNTTPLFVIDGVFANSLSAINPNDIASMEILKDASAAAIYGSRAANGVVIITTKSGTGNTGALKTNFNLSYGLQTAAHKPGFLNATDYADLINKVADADGVPKAVKNSTGFDATVNEDYQKYWFVNAPIFNAGVDVSSSSDNLKFYSSANYLDQQSILANSNFKRYDFRVNMSKKINRFKIEEFLSVNRTENKPNYAYSGSLVGLDAPTIPFKNPDIAKWGVNSQGYNKGDRADGYFITNFPSASGSVPYLNPFAYGALSSWQENTNNVNGSLKLSAEIISGLTFSTSYSAFYTSGSSIYNTPTYTLTNIAGTNPVTIASRSYTENLTQFFQYTWDNLLNYKKSIGVHDIDVLLGQSWFQEYARSVMNTAGATNFSSNAVTNPQGSISTSTVESGAGLLSLFGRVNYSYDSRYLFTASLRSDQSSKFGPSNRVGIYPSFSVGWNLHNEKFFPQNHVITTAKLRGSYGELGANFIPAYSYLNTIRSTLPFIAGDGTRSFATITQLGNPDIKWETSKTFDIGFDLGLFKNRLYIIFDYFDKRTTDLLVNFVPPFSSGQALDLGTSQYYINAASTSNKGVELTVEYRKTTGAFNYNISANITSIKNKVESLGDGVQPIPGYRYSGTFDDAPTLTKAGLPIGNFWGYQVLGVYQTSQAAEAAKVGKKPGDFIYQDINGDGKIDLNDKTNIGSPFALFEYALNFTANYSNFDVTVYFTGTYGNKIFNASKYTSYFLTTQSKSDAVKNSWIYNQSSNTHSTITTRDVAGNNALPNSFYVEDGSYLRLKNLQIGYTLAKKNLPSLPFSSLRLYFSIQNLFTITNYSGYDPEIAALPANNLNSTSTAGRGGASNILFNRGVDNRAYPRDRTYIFGLQMSL